MKVKYNKTKGYKVLIKQCSLNAEGAKILGVLNRVTELIEATFTVPHIKAQKLSDKERAQTHREPGPVFEDVIPEGVCPGNLFVYWNDGDIAHLVCTTIKYGMPRFSGYTQSGELVGEYRLDAEDMTRWINAGLFFKVIS